MSAAETKPTESVSVKPSSRDPIAQWLDVFTSLLSLPPAEAERIRDELEDHLRTRVDDLLILGMTEPEAVQKAVTELGETAQLARNFKSVRTHSRRRIAMHTALFAAAGLALTVSVAGLLPGKALTPLHAPTAAIEGQPEGVTHNAVLDQDLEAGTLGEMLQKLADAGNARLFVHWSSLEPLGLDADTEVRAIPAKGLDHAKVRQLINSALGLEGLDELAARMDGNLVEIGSVRYFDRIETVLVEYDLSSLTNSVQVQSPRDPRAFNRMPNIQIYDIVEPVIWREQMGSVVQDGSILTVRAPKRVQAEVKAYIDRLIDRQIQAESESIMLEEKRRSQTMARHEKQVAAVAQSLIDKQSEIESLQQERDKLAAQYWRSEMEIKQLESQYASTDSKQELAQIRDSLIEQRVQLEALVADRDRIQHQLESAWVRFDATEDYLASLKSSEFGWNQAQAVPD